MTRVLVMVVVTAAFTPAASPPAQTARWTAGRLREAGRWFPTAAGTERVYRSGGQVMTIRMAASDADGTRLETVVADKVVATESVQVRLDGVYRTRINGQAITPPVRFLALTAGSPAADGTSWTLDSDVGGSKLAGELTQAREAVTVPAGKYEAVVVRGPAITVGGVETALTYWFARDTGVVKLAYRIAGNDEVALELAEAPKP